MARSLAVVAAGETRGRRAASSRGIDLLRRWVLGAGLWAIAIVVATLVVPDPARGLRLLDRMHLVSGVIQGLVLLAVIDLVQALVHRLLHRIPALWRLHAVHHADRSFDAPTSLRFHPAETLLRAVANAAVLVALGPDDAVLLWVVVVRTCWNIFEHADVALPASVERALATVFVTPGVHRVHHAVARALHDTNYGTVFTLWDRVMGTYHAPVGSVVPVGLTRWDSGDDLVDNLLAPWREPRSGAGN